MSRVDIGFPEKCQSCRIQNTQFPSKIGGKPAWLSLKHLPAADDLKCETCTNPKTFLCQVYAPYEECEHNFHRTLFVFACRNASCYKENDNSNFAIFRDNIPRRNEYYSYEPPSDATPADFDATKWTKLCALCGCKADKICSKCKKTPYCSREHQVLHWKEKHKTTCGTSSNTSDNGKNANNVEEDISMHLFPQYELVIEPEELDEKKEVDVGEQLKQYEALKSAGKAGMLSDATDSELDRYAAVEEDETFSRFRKRVECQRDQVLRYARAGVPLWIAKQPQPKDDEIPKCEYCQSPRRFEFQVMPQMLNLLKDDAIEFGILAVYTCTKSCWDVTGYKEEFIFKQDVGPI